MSDLEGGCACGSVRYKITQPPMAVGVCHCRQCQYSSGGGPNYVALAPRTAFELTKGYPKGFKSAGGSGSDVERVFCPECGTPLYSDPTSMPFLAVKVGSLDDPSALSPAMHIWTAEAPPWHQMTPGLPAFPQGPPG
ncbi:MAG: GFA family protein [Pseudomonadota bacterium]|uniref:GFA family protein n=1 Tax=Phenylobacterium sp. TaxID=1871053 RepID=UPI0025D493EC|nr:GFA family protein [Phenylobacterium sp.]MBT9473061.1 GFA family protein [Phenylobacterium sp.]